MNFVHIKNVILVTLSGILISACSATSGTKIATENGHAQQQAAPPLCTIALVPPGGRVVAGVPFRVAANTNMGCTVSFNGETIAPPGAFNPTCIQVPPAAANSIAVPCGGTPAPVNPPVSAMGMSFSCSCPPGVGLGNSNLNESYLF